jgi:hypothetical protein
MQSCVVRFCYIDCQKVAGGWLAVGAAAVHTPRMLPKGCGPAPFGCTDTPLCPYRRGGRKRRCFQRTGACRFTARSPSPGDSVSRSARALSFWTSAVATTRARCRASLLQPGARPGGGGHLSRTAGCCGAGGVQRQVPAPALPAGKQGGVRPRQARRPTLPLRAPSGRQANCCCVSRALAVAACHEHCCCVSRALLLRVTSTLCSAERRRVTRSRPVTDSCCSSASPFDGRSRWIYMPRSCERTRCGVAPRSPRAVRARRCSPPVSAAPKPQALASKPSS